jgi:pimeloyl-ACP methyl ester carboxylesterase
MPTLTTADGRTLAWEERGSGEPLLLHPGGPGFSGKPFADQPELAGERTLLILDQRGTGDSSRPADPSAYDLDQYAADVEAVRNHLGLDRLDLIGHSFGGFVAINWAGSHPESVERLVLAGAVPRFTDAIRHERIARATAHQGEPYFQDAMAAMQRQQADDFSSDEELGALYEAAPPLFAPHGVDSSAVIERLKQAGTNADAVRHFNERVAPTMDQRELLGQIVAPTLLITGEGDPFRHSMDEMADALPDSASVLIPGADHFVLLEPENRPAWSRAVLEFLAAG